MNMMYISLRKAMIVGASTTAVLLGAAPARADLFIVDYTGPGGTFNAAIFTATSPTAYLSSLSRSGDHIISYVDMSKYQVLSGTPLSSGAPLGAPGPVPGAGLLSLAFFIVAGAKTKLREIVAFAHKTRPRSMRAGAVR